MASAGRRGRDEDDDEDDDDIGEYVVEGKELKRAIKRGRRRNMPFAFCPVSGDEVTWFATHKKKPAARIARKTRRESGQFKVAFGTYIVEGRLLILSCIESIPQLARRMKKHLARDNVRMNVRVLDANGLEIDADIEDYGDDLADEDDDDDDDEDDDAVSKAVPGRRARPTSSGDSFSERLEAVQGPILAARGESGERLRQLLAAVFDAQDKGDRVSATTLLDRLEDHVLQLMNSASRPTVASPRKAPGPAPGGGRKDAPPVDRKPQVVLARSVRALRSRIESLGGDEAGRLMEALAIGARQIKGGDLIGAAETIEKVSEALARVEARA